MTLYFGLGGLPGLDANPFRHIQENLRLHPGVAMPAGDLGHDATAVVVRDGQAVFAVEEERLNRQKHSMGVPELAMAACLAHAGEPDAAAFYLNPTEADLQQRVEACVRFQGSEVETPIRAEFNRLRKAVDAIHQRVPGLRPCSHHLSHAASAFYLSGFARSLVMVADGTGEAASLSLYLGDEAGLRLLSALPITSSLGILYGHMTHYLGFEPIEDEYKVMGLAAYGEGDEYREFFDDLIQWNGDDSFHIPCLLDRPMKRLFDWSERLGPLRVPEVPLDARFIAIAHGLQSALERTVVRLLEPLEAQLKTGHLCLAGGVALNCSLNGVLDRSGIFDQLFVQPAANDPGAALGAALLAYHADHPGTPGKRMATVYLGPAYPTSRILEALRAFQDQVVWDQPQDYVGDVAALLAQGKVVGWYQGRMEFGPRALGNRSILADPRRPDMKDRVNQAVKKREEFRPFAPSVTDTAAETFFELRTLDQYEHMTIAVKAKPARAAEIPAVVHVNGTARVQVVRPTVNPRYWDLLNRFGALTGVPVLLNTSFNVRGEPIVCTPEDALRCFLGTGIDNLALDGFLVSKR